MRKLTGNCLCGQVNFGAVAGIAMQDIWHCTDCQQVSDL